MDEIHQPILTKLEKYVQLDTRQQTLLKEAFVYREVPEKFRLVEIGTVSRELYFIIKGCGRLYYLKEGVEVSGFLFTENMFMGSFESFLSTQPSAQIIETVEPSALFVLSKTKLDQLYEQLPIMNEMFRKILEERFINAQKVVASFVLNKPEERYEALLRAQPELFNRFPQNMLASYLGITPVSLSRIRQRIMKKP